MAIPTGSNQRNPQGAAPPRQNRGRRSIERVHQEHVVIVQHLKDLTARLAPLSGACHPGELRNDISGRLARLQSELAEHFAHEERVGFLPEATAQAPRLTRRARNIISEHDLLRAELSKVVGALARGSGDWTVVREDWDSFTSLLREHEKKENELINEAYLDDLGGGS